jgi:hypothetical protein
MVEPRYRVGQKIYLKSDPFQLETIRRVSTDHNGLHRYYTTTWDGKQRCIPLPEHFIRLAEE